MSETAGRAGSTPDTAGVYQRLRPLMFAIAYRMISSVSEAEDIVQEAFLRYHRASGRPGRSSRRRRSCPR